MEFSIEIGRAPSHEAPLGVFTFENALAAMPLGLNDGTCVGEIYNKMVQYKEIKGEPGEAPYCLSCSPVGPDRVYFIGLGQHRTFDMEHFRKAGGSLARRLRRFGITEIDLVFPHLEGADDACEKRCARAFIEGFLLRNYDFSKYLAAPEEGVVAKVRFLESDSRRAALLAEAVSLGELFANATNVCRDIANEPANVLTPTEMARRAVQIGGESPRINVEIFGESEISELGMGLFEAVARSASTPPRLITMYYTGRSTCAPTVALVGKGITFDSGGISMKDASGMFRMKRDLSGGAAVLAVMHAIGRMDLDVNVVAVIGSSENMVGSRAYKPGDIVRSMAGKTVEVLNTDAEGRLVLADLLTYVQRRWKPDFIIDIATLTGNIVRALGSNISGILSNDDGLSNQLIAAGERSFEKLWRMPLESSYRKLIKSHFADLKNITTNAPDAIFAGLFLEAFVENGTPWAHLDIAATDTHSGEPNSYHLRGATGVGTRLLLEYLLELADSPYSLKACYGE